MWKKISVGVIATMLLGTTAMAAGNTVSLTMSGSTSVYPLAQDLAQAYNAQHTDKTSFQIGQGDSDVGIQDAATGMVDIGNSSRNLKQTEVAYGLVATPIARDAVAVVVNPFNPVRNLTTRQIAGIFNGTITNWAQVGGNNVPIHVNSYTASSGSDTLDCFSEHFLGGSMVVTTASQWDSSIRLRQAVTADPNAIGFLSLADFDGSVQAPSLDGQVVSLAAARSGQYNVIQTFSMVTKGQPTGLTKAFIDWVLSPAGQAIVTRNYLPLQSGQAMVVKGQQERSHRLLRHQLGISPTGFHSNR